MNTNDINFLPTFDNADCIAYGARTAPIVAVGDELRLSTTMQARGIVKVSDGFSTYRYPIWASNGPIKSVACEVRKTGTRTRKLNDAHWVVGQITFVGDGEPDTTHRCWIRVA